MNVRDSFKKEQLELLKIIVHDELINLEEDLDDCLEDYYSKVVVLYKKIQYAIEHYDDIQVKRYVAVVEEKKDE